MSDLVEIGGKVALFLIGSGSGYLGAAFRLMQKFLDFERKVETLEREVRELHSAQAATATLISELKTSVTDSINNLRLQYQSCATCRFDAFVTEDTERWRELERSLGRIEGQLKSQSPSRNPPA